MSIGPSGSEGSFSFSFSSSNDVLLWIASWSRGPHPIGLDHFFHTGAVAQLGERLICIQEVAGSIPTSSTNLELLSGL